MATFRVKTGCRTCKIRKVKCDEKKPFCDRCRRSGRNCDGYAASPPARQHADNSVATASADYQPSLAVNSMDLGQTLPQLQRMWVDRFHQDVAPALSGTFDNGFWTRLVPQLCHSEPAVLHGVLAVVTSYCRRQSFGAEGGARVACNSTELHHYSKSLSSLQTRMSETGDAHEVALVCCLLFVCFECLCRNKQTVRIHLRKGNRILEAATSQSHHYTIRQMFKRLFAQSALFGNRLVRMGELPAVIDPVLNDALPERYDNVFDAQSALDPLIHAAICLVQISRFVHIGTSEHDLVMFYQGQLEWRMLRWKASFDELEEGVSSTDGSSDASSIEAAGSLTLLLRWTALFVWLQTCLSKGELAYDGCTQLFRDIVSWSRELIAIKTSLSRCSNGVTDRPIQHAFELEQCIVPALYLTAIKCRIGGLRRQAIELLEGMSSREWLWDTRLHAKVARRIVEIEETLSLEGDTLAEGPFFSQQPRSPVPDRCRIRNASLHESEDGSSVRVDFYNLPDGPTGRKHEWRETLSVS